MGSIQALPPSLFRDGYLTIECLAHYDDLLFAKKEISLKQNDSKYKSGSGSYSNNNGYGNSNSR